MNVIMTFVSPDTVLASAAAGGTEDIQRRADLLRRGGGRFGKAIFLPERLPLEAAHLMEWQHLDPFNIRHRRNELRDLLDVPGSIRQAGNQHEAHPDRLTHRVQPPG